MIHPDRLPLLVPALLRQPNWANGVFAFRFSGEGPVETAPMLVTREGATVVVITPLPAWVAHLGQQPIDLQLRTNDPDILCALEMYFEAAVAALHTEDA
jgi:hypothetical protein